jgi:hypothetical protein
MTELDVDGSTTRSVALEHDTEEQLGAVVLVGDRFCVAWEATTPPASPTSARVSLHADDGTPVWTTEVSVETLSFPGVVEMSRDTNWRPSPMAPWTPSYLQVAYRSPLLVSGHRVAATFFELRSGIGTTFFLDLRSGHILTTTAPGPCNYNAIAATGEFFIAQQGYGATETVRYDSSGMPAEQWPTNALLVTDSDGRVRGPEYQNVLPSKSRFIELRSDGAVRNGDPLTGYYTSYPAVDDHGSVVFWRDGELVAVDSKLKKRVLLGIPRTKREVLSRTLILDEGRVALALYDDLLMATNTDLGSLAISPWPCDEGGLRGNPSA